MKVKELIEKLSKVDPDAYIIGDIALNRKYGLILKFTFG